MIAVEALRVPFFSSTCSGFLSDFSFTGHDATYIHPYVVDSTYLHLIFVRFR